MKTYRIRNLSTILVISIMLSLFVPAYAAAGLSEPAKGQNQLIYHGTAGDKESIKWTLKDGVLTITGKGSAYGFKNREDLPEKKVKKIVIDGDVTSVGYSAFGGYEYADTDFQNVTSVEIKGKKVKTIGEFAFANMESLKKITMTDSVEEIEQRAFYFGAWPISKIESITLSNNIKKIENWTFGACVNLKKLKLPSKLEIIDGNAFQYMGLTTIEIPAKVKSIGSQAFIWCNDLKKITVNKNNKYFKAKDGALYDKSVKTLVAWPGAKEFKNLPKTVKNIGDGSINTQERIDGFEIPNGVVKLGSSVINKSGKLSNIVVPSSVKSVDRYTFSSYGLKDIWFRGSEQEWKAISIAGGDSLYFNPDAKPAIHYNYSGSGLPSSKVSAAANGNKTKITEADLYKDYSEYLEHKAINQTLNGMSDLLWDCAFGMDDAAVIRHTVLDIDNDAKIFLYSITGQAEKYDDKVDRKNNAAIALKLMQKMPEGTYTGPALAGKVKEAISIINPVLKTYRTGKENDKLTVKQIEEISKSIQKQMTDKKVTTKNNDSTAKIIKWFGNSEQVKKALKTTGYVLDITDIITTSLALHFADIECATMLRDFAKRTGATVLETMMDQEVEYLKSESFIKTFLTQLWLKSDTKVVNAAIELTKAIAKKAGHEIPSSTVFAVAVLACDLIRLVDPHADADELIKAQKATTVAGTLLYMVAQKRDRFIRNKAENDTSKFNRPVEIEEYKFLFDSMLAAMDVAYSEVNTLNKSSRFFFQTKSEKEKKLNKYKASLDAITYNTYIKNCLSSVNTNYMTDGNVCWGPTAELKTQATVQLMAEDDGGKNVFFDIPEELAGKPVKMISSRVSDSKVTNISLPENLEVIGEESFADCYNLEEVVFGGNEQEIRSHAFQNCKKLKELTIPYSVSEIADDAFNGVDNLTIVAPKGSYAEKYANSHSNIQYKECPLKEVFISTFSSPKKSEVAPGEKIDLSGVKLGVEYEDGSLRYIDEKEEGLVFYMDEPSPGTNQIWYYYKDLSNRCWVDLKEGNKSYTVSYKDKNGKTIAKDYTGKAKVGEKVSIPMPRISGYTTPESVEKTIGYNDHFEIVYDYEYLDISDATIKTINNAGASEKNNSSIIVTLNGEQLKEGKDYVVYQDLSETTEKAEIIGEGRFYGFKWFNLKEQQGESTGFVDVKVPSWYSDAVEYVVGKGYMAGVGNNRFAPEGTVTRGTIAQILYAAEGKPSVKAGGRFTDVAKGKWYANAVDWAAEKELVAGYGNKKFGPDDAITRQQMVAIMYQYAKMKDYDLTANADLSKYKDQKTISAWAKTPVKWAVGHNVITGTTKGIEPNGTATRAQIAVILRAFDNNVRK